MHVYHHTIIQWQVTLISLREANCYFAN